MFCDATEGWHMHDNRCYSVSDIRDSWLNAELMCQQISGDLVTINDDQEQFFILDEALKHHDNVWIGMTEIGHAGQFYWIGDNSTEYTNWAQNKSMPQSMGGTASAVVDAEDASGQWLTENAVNDHIFVCERPTGACVAGWEEFGDSCYYFNRLDVDVVTWLTAHELCQGIGTHLLVVDSQEEDDFIRGKISEGEQLWIGLYFKQNNTAFKWVDGSLYSNTINSLVTDTTFFLFSWSGACVAGWEEFGDSCYYFNRLDVDVVTWLTAHELCQGIGTHLLVVDSQEEDDFIRGKISEGEQLWIGLYFKQNNTAFKWVDGSLYSNNITHMSQQDEDDVIAEGESKCVAAQIDTSTEVNEESWDPLTCTETHNYICEVAAGTPVYIHVPPLEQYCPDGWVLDQDFCYLVSSNEMTWSSAESFCQTAGGHLASINSWIEQDTVHNHLDDTSWIGLNDRRVDGVFEWSDGNAVVIQNWNMGEPSGGDGNCVEMKIEEGFWNDMTCSEAQPFVCKRGYSTTPLGPVTTTTPAPDSGSCGEGWEEDSTSGICYLFVNELLAQADARLRCQEMPYSEGQSVPDLTSLSNEDEQLFVEGMVARAHVQDHGVYIGLKNDYSSLYWTDGEPVTILNYADGEPNGYCYDSCTGK
ncbi:C-type mannose receptor 2-like [Hyalella azteca]|uniref:C-type mannose receptor 2-like n=1 Tax=Hyalella azteca TaxID=294128 RepID=A0A8B7NTG6_HYAAZ|nr:C-type mannose receptor 2-like [Hyalella azteca]